MNPTTPTENTTYTRRCEWALWLVVAQIPWTLGAAVIGWRTLAPVPWLAASGAVLGAISAIQLMRRTTLTDSRSRAFRRAMLYAALAALLGGGLALLGLMALLASNVMPALGPG